MTVIRPKKPRVIKPGSKSKVKKPKKSEYRNAKGQFVKKRFENRDILGRFTKQGKKPPVRYRRKTPKGMNKIGITLKDKKLKSGYLLEFTYGKKQKKGEVGGWKNDPRPVIFLFHDDKIKYIEGINTNYLSEYYLKKVRQIMMRFPGLEGEQLYIIFKRTAKYALKKGYRKYMRDSFRNIFLYVYEDELTRTLDDLVKSEQSDFGTADRSKNPSAEM